MKKKIATLMNPDNNSPMGIYYNGKGNPMTAENESTVEEVGYTPNNIREAEKAVEMMYGSWPWELEWE